MVRAAILAALAMVLSGCASQRWDPAAYPVASGDTIYSIAWKYELDPFELARWNNISHPYRIYPGQRLTMRPPGNKSQSRAQEKPTGAFSGSRPEKVTVTRGDTLYSLARQYDMSVSSLASINGLKSPYTIRPGQTIRLKATKDKPPPAGRSRQTRTASLPDDNRTIDWQWPVQGRLITTFNSNKSGRKGIDIAAKEGKDIRAAAPGKVVYSGNGLISYGNLVIIKHNRTYLSAYAHNRKLLVKEGDAIRAGQKIAELGQTGTESPRLHFEIRKNGKPVNPLKYLPTS